MIVAGYGVLCSNEEIFKQLKYIEKTWERTKEHISQDHSLNETLNDPDFPRYSELGFEKLHPWNIKVIYQQLKKRDG